MDFDSYYESPDTLIDKIINYWLRRPGLIKRLQISLNDANPIPGKKILEIGCGSGKFIVECQKKEAIVCGVDISKEMIQLAKKNCEKNNVSADLRIGDATQDLPKGFDVCVALGVFEYFKDPKPMIQNMLASTRGGGRIIFSVPSLYALQTPLRKIFLGRRKVDCYYYTKKRVYALLKDFNDCIKQITFSSYGPGYVISLDLTEKS